MVKLNKKLILLSSILVLALFVISACQDDAVGRRIIPIENNKEVVPTIPIENGNGPQPINQQPKLDAVWTELENGYSVVVTAKDESGLQSIGGELTGPGPSSGIGSGHSCGGDVFCSISFSLEEGAGSYYLSASATDTQGSTGDYSESMEFVGEQISTDEIIIEAAGEKVDLTTKNYDGDLIDVTIFYANTTGHGDILLGKDRDEPLIVVEGDIVTNLSMAEQELSDMNGIRFLYYINNRAHVVKITRINVVANTTDFRVQNTGIAYTDQQFIPEAGNSYTFLPNTFMLNFSSQHNLIHFLDINDEADGVSKIKTPNGAIITLDEEESKISIKEENGREAKIYLIYDNVNQEINLALRGVDEIRGTTNFGTTLEGQLPGGSGSDIITFHYPS